MNPVAEVPTSRLRVVADLPPARGRHVLYWMTASRRFEDSFAMQQAAWWAAELDLPLLVVEPLSSNYRWASDRLHAFVLQGMADNAKAAEAAGVRYLAYVEPTPGQGKGLLGALAAEAAVVVIDDYPTSFPQGMAQSLGEVRGRRIESVDGNGMLPMRATATVYPTAYGFRRYLQKTLPAALDDLPLPNAVGLLPRRLAPVPDAVADRWPTCLLVSDDASVASLLDKLPIDHRVGISKVRGGAKAARSRLRTFLEHDLPRYHLDRNHPDLDASSGLSPYLHFGHIATHRVFAEVMTRDRWTRRQLSPRPGGQREGWWNATPPVEAFLDQCLTWRELGFNFCVGRDDYDQYDSLPDWARASLDAHASDPREFVYTLDEFAAATTHDPLWNAAQRQLTREGQMHNYLRMLWGKKILEWSPTPQDALATMIELNNRYALDGCDPNSYSGIFWTLGRYDRPWAPRRPIFGVIRYMSSLNTARKLKLKRYLARYSEAALPL